MIQIPEPFQFNPLKHHLLYIREFISDRLAEEKNLDIKTFLRDLKHTGTSVMDVYTGSLPVGQICREVLEFLHKNRITEKNVFSKWTGINYNDYRIIELSDKSQWMLKYNNDEKRYVHVFPARQSPNSFRVKANTLKSAILYYVVIGKDYVTRKDLNLGRSLLGLSPIKGPEEAEAITEMIEILRN